jgi:nucleotide-binding universal stress UspA family protein
MSAWWNTELVVVNVAEPGHNSHEVLSYARSYLEKQGSPVIFSQRQGLVAEEILRTTEEYECDLIIMGGYGFDPLMEIVLGSTVDEVLRKCRQPVLICR